MTLECLIFYLKHYPEMTKLYREEEDVPSLPEPEDTKEKASKVGKEADAEALAFLDECGKLIVSHFSSVGSPNISAEARVEKRAECEKSWSTSYRIWPRGGRRSERMKVGVSFLGMASGKPELAVWIWRVGDESEQQGLVYYLTLAGKAKGTWKDIELIEGAVALARLPIAIPSEGFQMDGTVILRDVADALRRIDQNDLTQLYP